LRRTQRQGRPELSITLASYNIQYGTGKDGRLDLDRIAAEIGDADIVALQEVESGNPNRGLIDQPAAFARLLGHPHWSYGAGVDIHLGERVPGGYPGLRQKFGNLILSRWPLLSVLTHALPKLAVRGATHLQRTAIEAVIATPDGPLRLVTAHLDHLSPLTRMPQVAMLRDLVLGAARRGPPWGGVPGNPAGFGDPGIPWPRGAVLIGDMNFSHEGPEYEHMVGDISPMTGERVLPVEGLADAWVLTGHKEADGVTFIRPGRKRERIDHCFVTSDLIPALRAMRIDDAATGSDHQPIFVTLDLPRMDATA
jgi:endonuclease/exonuclease/phosphatase family metal-dependent hydrolase